MENTSDIYFAADEAEKTVTFLTSKAEDWFSGIRLNGYLDKLQRSWDAYYGNYYNSDHDISFSGDQGEFANIAVNHYRNIAQFMLVTVTSNRPSFQPRSINTDRKSLVQTNLARGLLDYYLREKRLERQIRRATEYAIVLGCGYIKMEWNSTKGEIYDYIEPASENIAGYNEEGFPIDENGNKVTPFPVYEGDVEFTTLGPTEVVFDPLKENPELHDWVLCRSFINKYDLAAKYPEFRDQILAQDNKAHNATVSTFIASMDITTDIPVYEFYHKRTEALPSGRYLLYIDDQTILVDTVMPYKNIPIYRMSAADVLGTSYGYSIMWDLLPIQDAINSLYSTILTNHNAFGVQNVINPRGNDVKVSQISGGLNFIEYNSQVGKPEPINLTNTPGEIFTHLQMMEKNLETVSAMNSVLRGNPESSLKSGTALALVQSQALQFISGLQQSYIQLVEDVGTGLINLLKDFAKVPRIATIAGITNRSKIKEFVGDDLDTINRVVVDVGNALSQTVAGRVQIAEQLLQMGQINAEQFVTLINTGNLDALTEKEFNENDLMRAENERLIKGEAVNAVSTDKHSLHIREHRATLADPDLRKDPDLVKATLDHIMEHLNLLRTTDPALLAVIGEQPLGPAAGSPPSLATMAPDMPPTSSLGQLGNIIEDLNKAPEVALPTPPAPFENNPVTPEQAFTQQAIKS